MRNAQKLTPAPLNGRRTAARVFCSSLRPFIPLGVAIVVQTVDPLLLLLVPWIANRIWQGARVPTSSSAT